MNASKYATSKKLDKSVWLAGVALMVAAALAITFAARSAPAKPAAEPPTHAQNVPDAAANQRELDHLRALGANIPLAGPELAAPDTANQRELDYLRALGANIP
jgi:hypothetical protein